MEAVNCEWILFLTYFLYSYAKSMYMSFRVYMRGKHWWWEEDVTCELLMVDMTWKSNRFEWLSTWNVCDVSLPKHIWYLTRVPVDVHFLIKLCVHVWSGIPRPSYGVHRLLSQFASSSQLYIWPISRILHGIHIYSMSNMSFTIESND